MKLLILSLVTILSSQTFAAVAGRVVLANPGDFGVVSDVATSRLTVSLSGSGVHYGQCGIALRSANVSAEELQSVLDLRGQTKGAVGIEDGRLVAKVADPKKDRFGENFIIATKSGETLSAAISQLNDTQKVDVIVEALGCN